MKCVILAAGQGRRLKRSDSKPLTSLLGLPLIERTMRTAMEGGVTGFVVVTGYQAERVSTFVRALGERLQVEVTTVNNPDWEHRENGCSLLCARPYLQQAPFLLTMADHLFEADTVRRLLGASLPEGGILLACDHHRCNPLVDLEDVTRLRVDTHSGAIQAIGKGLADYNAFDTGLFLCAPGFLDRLQEAIDAGDSTLSGAVRRLADQGQARTLDVSGAFWIDVDDDAAFRRAEEALLGLARGKERDGPVSRYLNRPLSARLSKRLAYTGLTPNQISLLSFGLSLLGAALMLIPHYWGLLLGGILAQGASIVDGCDGEIARLKHQQSDYGGWLDAVLDRYSDALLLTALALHCWQIGTPAAIPIGFLAVTGALVLSYTADKYDGLMRDKGGSRFRLGRDLRLLVIALGALFNLPLTTLVVIATTMNGEAIRRMVVCRG
ncbi:NTP transferase domain-containing protein [Microbulbifer thermotolerans]|uniref:Bifunctional IPC transferase and DIPP synthase n=1 Tax=Microbulbifer thermotolerans TaxID=252514 RepID=A0AB35I028_MICTH|nr:NTP transferase domain-containing protein [Microbulbifer thermotolerans]MCX2781868.1 NTP transferase domain-containing protein [Microbulbifer thermotolerans]MCX2802829.1 NTP transferase domain-containing protein [Microbulbifer thermotolerans]WKT62030.1 NTP transferase domain-containing protein [Microbulbifer thermotolerans]